MAIRASAAPAVMDGSSGTARAFRGGAGARPSAWPRSAFDETPSRSGMSRASVRAHAKRRAASPPFSSISASLIGATARPARIAPRSSASSATVPSGNASILVVRSNSVTKTGRSRARTRPCAKSPA